MDYLYKIMKLFLYMSIISAKRDTTNVDSFFTSTTGTFSSPWKCWRQVENLHSAVLIQSN